MRPSQMWRDYSSRSRYTGVYVRRLLTSVAVALLALAAMLFGTASPAAAATTVQGQVTCVGSGDVVGIWVAAENGGSGWATRWSSGAPWVNNYSKSLPNGGRYQVHVGCGGTSQNWATNNKSGWVSGLSNSFTCYGYTGAGWKYLTCQRT